MIYGYARVSTTDQDTQLQLDALRAAGAQRIYSEKISGKDNNRPELQKLLLCLKADDVLLVYRIDRLARSLSHLYSIIDQLNTSGASLKSITEPIGTDTIAGRALLGILGVFAQMERELIRERCISGQAAAMQNGVHCGRPPSYTEGQFLAVHALRAEGFTMPQIAADLGLGVNVVKRICYATNKSYCK